MGGWISLLCSEHLHHFGDYDFIQCAEINFYLLFFMNWSKPALEAQEGKRQEAAQEGKHQEGCHDKSKKDEWHTRWVDLEESVGLRQMVEPEIQ